MADTLTALTSILAGRCRVERTLGPGGTAMGHLADDVSHQRKVALNPREA
ncbi:MAG: hypothetical protein K0S86_8 [Geminicoccaceae bacterium]|nr:hypothetical protein [Geminicoccaceae bacterium]